MGNARWSPQDWGINATKTATQSRAQIFTQSNIHPDLDPKNIKVRESVDSAANPNSTPIILACDETGSMGEMAELIIKKGLGVIMQEIYDRKPVPDPHICAMAFGDAFCDHAPLQVSQFEASIVLAEQMKHFYLEGNGGGNGGESYSLPWYFAAYKTHCDAIIKRGRKGYLFTIGDETPHDTLTKDQIKQIMGDDVEADLETHDLLSLISPHWEVFHLIVKPVHHQNFDRWTDLLGERAIRVSDHEKLAEVIVSTIQVIEGADVDDVTKSWSGDTSLVVASAVGALAKRQAHAGVHRL